MANFIKVLAGALRRKKAAFFIMGDKVIDFPDVSLAYQQYADAVSKSIDDLTDIEKRQAVLNVILSEAE